MHFIQGLVSILYCVIIYFAVQILPSICAWKGKYGQIMNKMNNKERSKEERDVKQTCNLIMCS